MTSALLTGAVVALGVAAVACAPVLDSNNSQWTVTMLEPLAVQNPQTAQFEIEEWCPSLYFNNRTDEFGNPLPSTTTLAPHQVLVPLIGEDEDIYTFNPFFNALEFGNPIVFDIGPIGTFYEDQPNSYQVTGAAPGDITPVSMNVTRRIANGKASDEDNFTIDLDYEFDCGEAGTVTRGDVTCQCGTTRLTLEALASGVTF
jgi:hypothetical protein